MTSARVFLFSITLAGASAAQATMVDLDFRIGTGANWYVEQALEQSDGKTLICGLFSKFNEQDMAYMGRLNEDGSIDPTFHSQNNAWTRHMILQPDGKIVIGGMFTSIGGVSRNLIARLNADGSLDSTFNPGRGCEGSLGTGINGDPSPFVMWMERQPDGKIIATGNFLTVDGVSSRGIARFNPDGSRDASFNVGSGIDSWGRFIHLRANGQVDLGGWFNSYNGHTFNRLVRINGDGSADMSLNAFYGDKTAVYAIVELPDGKLITSGHSVNAQGLFNREIERLNPSGTVDASWPGHTNEKTESLLLQEDGKLIAGGYFYMVNDVWRPGIARFNADGALDDSVYAEFNNFIWGVSPARNGKLLVCGGFTVIDSISRINLARLILPESPGVTRISNARLENAKFKCDVLTSTNKMYVLQWKAYATDSGWTELPTATAGTGAMITFTDNTPGDGRFYRIATQ